MNYKQITEDERYLIKHHLKNGKTFREIADFLNRSHSSVSREIKRNSGKKGYRPKQADEYAEFRKLNKQKSTKLTKKVKDILRKYLNQFWSPEQISGWYLKSGKALVSVITIYRFIANDKLNGGTLWKKLRHSKKKYRKKYGTGASAKAIPNRVSIDDRPKVVDRKSRIGDWEIDTMVGANHKGVFITIVERKTKFTLIAKEKSKEAAKVSQRIISMLTPYKDKVHTITADNGKEFMGHEVFGSNLEADVYFAHPYSSWERGLNENTNGLIRQFFPKGTSFRGVKEKSIEIVQNLLNSRPRKDLGFYTPAELFLNH